MFLDLLAGAILEIIGEWDGKDIVSHGGGVTFVICPSRGSDVGGGSEVGGSEVGGSEVGGSEVGGGAFVAVGGGTSVAVGGTFVAVGGIAVFVGGTGVLVGAGRGVLVLGGSNGAGVASRGRRVLVGVMVTKGRGVSVGVGVIDAVLVGTIVLVAVGTNWVTACSVSATAVFKFATAKSTIFKGIRVAGI